MQNCHKHEKTLGLVITDGVGYRNFVLSDFLPQAKQQFDRIVIFSGLPRNVYQQERDSRIEVVELPIFIEPFKSWFWRKAKEVAHLQAHKENFGINDNLKANKIKSNSSHGIATRFIYGITNKFHKEDFILFLEAMQHRSIESNRVTKWCFDSLDKFSPDLLLFTHQRPPNLLPIFLAAKSKGIKTGAFIFSWDNLASKGRMAATFDFYLVWSGLMKKDLLYFYPKVNKNKVEVVGTPQFEPYVMEEYTMNRTEFYSKFELENGRKTIYYSCGDISTSRNDELYIESIATAIEQKEIFYPVNLLVRTSPAEDPDRFRFLKDKFPFIKWNYPEWKVSRKNHPEAWSQRVPSRQDLTDLRAILEYTDLNINMCSTMSLDFMLFEKPVINPVFGNEHNGLYNDQRFLNYAHYKEVVESGAVRIAKNKKELVKAINFYLDNPKADSQEREKLLELQIGKPLKRTSERIAKTLKKLVNS
ncbi:hypothetical protein J0871_07650 [Salegentibacter sp. BDJ18]|uniref:hypothetical protein n=1 Tax=Salegentibacter sp. BDJ18 TaxID=2816376 RepID=UPI001AAEABE0|nr:hypothetical protein [Salegentibacter sp. BDJ18]MBO2544287.1 hypothetical protein [Salegentibacter sp. BDJ18]